MNPRRLAVIGGGIAGLAAAHRATANGGQVTLFEADAALGGKCRTTPFAGLAAVDEGPDAFLARLPWATALARGVGLDDELVSPRAASAWIWWDGMQAIPEGLLLGLPVSPVGISRSGLISPAGKLRAATEVLRRRTPTDHDSLGRWVRQRFGAQVHERLVDPLVGSIYAADTDRFSLAAVAQLAELAGGPRSVILGSRRRPAPPPGPVFYSPRSGLGGLAAAVGAAIASAGGAIEHRQVAELAADGAGWRVHGTPFDAVVLACPAPAAASLLGRVAGEAALGLAPLPAADVAIITLAVPAATWPQRCHGRSGYLVPKPKQRLVTAVSFGSQKWAHWDDGEQVILRISLGRDGLPVLHLTDEALLTAAVEETSAHLGYDLAPTATRITRWPRAFPQYRPHHAATIAGVEARLPAGLALAGASYHGIGIPMCVRSGEAAADRLLAGP